MIPTKHNENIKVQYSTVPPHALPILRKACYRVCARLGLKSSSVSKQTRHLSYDHPSMVAVRNCVALLMQKENIDPRLMCHFDQVWSTQYEPAKRVLFKPMEESGQLKNDKSKPSTEKIVASLKQALSIVPDMPESSKKTVCQPPTLCAQSTLIPVEYQRNARTTTTLSFADGTMGRAYITATQTLL